MPEINTILIKRRTTGQPGAPTSLSGGELAFNEVNSVLYYGSENGVIPIGGSGEYSTNTLVSSISTNLNSIVTSVSTNLNSIVTSVSTNLNTFVRSNFLNLTGGTIDGNLNVNNKITAISGLEVFANSGSTTFFVSSGVVGINTKNPNQALTVSGNISASGLIYGDGSGLTGIVAGDTEATTLVRSNSAVWQSTYNTVSGLSGSWVRFQPNPEYVPADIAGAVVSHGSFGTQLLEKNSSTQYNSSNYILQYNSGEQKWRFGYDDGEGTNGECYANTTGGTYPWDVTYPAPDGPVSGSTPSVTQGTYDRITPKALSATAFEGTSIYAAKADHIHPFPTALEVGAAPIVNGKIPSEYIPLDYEDVSLFSSFLNLPNTTYTVTTNVSISGYNNTQISGNYTASNETPALSNSSRIYRKYIYPGYYFQLSVISSRWTITDMFGAVLVRATVNAFSNTPSQTSWSAGTTVSLVANSTPNSAEQNRIYITTDNNRTYRYDSTNNYYAPVNGFELSTKSDETMPIIIVISGNYGPTTINRNPTDYNSKPQYTGSDWTIRYNGSAWEARKWNYPDEEEPYEDIYTAVAGNQNYPWLAYWFNSNVKIKKANDLFYNAALLPKPLEAIGLIGTSNLAARADHVHPLPVNAANWDSVYSNVNSNSANISNYFPLSGGMITGSTRINSDLTVYGNISATGTSYFSNTIYSTTSALSVINIGNDGPALYIGNTGTGDIASFYDLDQNFEVFHIGGNNGSHPHVGVKTSTPNKDFTVNGELSASNTIYDGIGNSTQWNSVYNNTNSLSSRWESNFNLTNSLSSRWESDHNNTRSLSANWDSVYNGTRALSSRWESSFNGTNSLSSRWESNFNGTNSLSSRWESNFNGTRALSGNWNSVYNGTNSLSSSWQSTFNTVSALSGSWLTYQPYPDDLVTNNADSNVTVNGNTVLTKSIDGQGNPRYDLYYDAFGGGFHVFKDTGINRWSFEKNNCGNEDCGQEYIYTSLTDAAYPWLATWGAGVRVEKTQKPRLISSLSATTFEGISNFAARADHTHAFPNALQVGAAPIVNGLIPSQYLPSYVDDVIEIDTYSNLPVQTFVLSGSATYNGNYRATGSTAFGYPTYLRTDGVYTLRRRQTPTRWQVTVTSTGSEVLRSTTSGDSPATATWQSPITVVDSGVSPGATGKIYVVLDTGKCYRWSGSMYVEISNTLELALVQIPDSEAPAIVLSGSVTLATYPRVGDENGKPNYFSGTSGVQYYNGRWVTWFWNSDGDFSVEDSAAIGNEAYPWLADWTGQPRNVTRNGTYNSNLLPKNLTSIATTGTSALAARADHTHALPSALEISAAPIVNGKIPAQYLPEALDGGTF